MQHYSLHSHPLSCLSTLSVGLFFQLRVKIEFCTTHLGAFQIILLSVKSRNLKKKKNQQSSAHLQRLPVSFAAFYNTKIQIKSIQFIYLFFLFLRNSIKSLSSILIYTAWRHSYLGSFLYPCLEYLLSVTQNTDTRP